jgi:MFS family permease
MGIALVIGGAAGPLLMGWLSDRNVARGRPAARLRLFTPATPVMAFGVALIAFAGTPTIALAGMCIVTLCAVGFATMLFTGIQDICPNQLRGRMVAASTICTNVIGIALGPTLLAFVKEYLLPAETSLALAYGIVSAPIIVLGVTIAVAGYEPFARAEARAKALNR